MSDTVRTRSYLQSALNDNTTGAITAQDLRDWLASSQLTTEAEAEFLQASGGIVTGPITGPTNSGQLGSSITIGGGGLGGPVGGTATITGGTDCCGACGGTITVLGGQNGPGGELLSPVAMIM
jgi:hypothetical protein